MATLRARAAQAGLGAIPELRDRRLQSGDTSFVLAAFPRGLCLLPRLIRPLLIVRWHGRANRASARESLLCAVRESAAASRRGALAAREVSTTPSVPRDCVARVPIVRYSSLELVRKNYTV